MNALQQLKLHQGIKIQQVLRHEFINLHYLNEGAGMFWLKKLYSNTVIHKFECTLLRILGSLAFDSEASHLEFEG